MSGDIVPVGPPSTGELDVLMRQAEALAPSGIIPRDYQRNPANILAAALMGRAFGWDALTAMRMVTVIQGTASLKPEAMLALVRQRGHHVTISVHPDGRGVTVAGKRADNGDTAEASFTVGDAERAGLLKNAAWKSYPVDMCQWRAVARLSRALFGDVVLGAGYVPEEIGGTPDTSGETYEASPWVAPAAVDIVDAEVVEEDTSRGRDWLADIAATDDVELLRVMWSECQEAGVLELYGQDIRRRVNALKDATPIPPRYESEPDAGGDAATGIAAVREALKGAQA